MDLYSSMTGVFIRSVNRCEDPGMHGEHYSEAEIRVSQLLAQEHHKLKAITSSQEEARMGSLLQVSEGAWP